MNLLNPFLTGGGSETIPSPASLKFYMPLDDGTITDETGNYGGFLDSGVSSASGIYLGGSHSFSTAVSYVQWSNPLEVAFTDGLTDLPFTIFGVVDASTVAAGRLNLIFNKWRDGSSTREYRMGINSIGLLFVQTWDNNNTVALTATGGTTISSGDVFSFSFVYGGTGSADDMYVFLEGVDDTNTRVSGAGYERMRNGNAAHSRICDDRFGSNYGLIMDLENFGCWPEAITEGQALTLHNDYLNAGVKLL